jgi:hypothetical protein
MELVYKKSSGDHRKVKLIKEGNTSCLEAVYFLYSQGQGRIYFKRPFLSLPRV